MSPKKKKRPGTAQQLIDSLLDERTPTPRGKGDVSQSVRLVSEEELSGAFRDVGQNSSAPKFQNTLGEEPVFDSPDSFSNPLILEDSKNKIPKGDIASQVATQVAKHQAMKPQLARTSPGSVATAPTSTSHSSTKPTRPTHSSSDARPTNSQHQDNHDEVTATVPGQGVDSVNVSDPAGSDKTVRLDSKRRPESTASNQNENSQNPRYSRSGHGGKNDEPSIVDRGGLTELKTVVRMRGERSANSGPEARSRSSTSAAGGFSSAEAQLKQSESLRIAQGRMTELEVELERLRRENERLASAGETLGRRADELAARSENLDLSSKEAARIHEEERRVFRGQIQAKDRENSEMRARLEEMEGRLENNFKKIRVRERELEHRLEIVRMESATLVSTKDKMILDLKRQIDQLTHENDYSKQKSQELYNQYKDKQETARRVVRALRIALTILEGEEDTTGKKPE